MLRSVNEESADIFRAYEMLLTDEYLLQSIRKRVEKEITLKDAVFPFNESIFIKISSVFSAIPSASHTT